MNACKCRQKVFYSLIIYSLGHVSKRKVQKRAMTRRVETEKAKWRKLKFISIAFNVNFTQAQHHISVQTSNEWSHSWIFICWVNFSHLVVCTSIINFEEKLSLRKLNKKEEVKKLVTKHKDINLSATVIDDELCRIFKITTQAAPHIQSKAASREKFHFSKCGKSSHEMLLPYRKSTFKSKVSE